MRWIVLIFGTLVMSGCAELSTSLQDRHERIANALKDWWKSGHSDAGGHSYQDESDGSKAHHEQTVVDTLNNWVGNRTY